MSEVACTAWSGSNEEWMNFETVSGLIAAQRQDRATNAIMNEEKRMSGHLPAMVLILGVSIRAEWFL
jgi:hypothetical protein